MRHLVQKALYLGVGIASYAAEKAGSNLQELRVQAQKLADELVERGEMTTEEARRFVEERLREAQTGVHPSDQAASPNSPRPITIVDEEDVEIIPVSKPPSSPEQVEDLRKQVEALQAELQRLRQS
ncbi:MAG: phasin family protein [Microcystaceae cyanobacterium]